MSERLLGTSILGGTKDRLRVLATDPEVQRWAKEIGARIGMNALEGAGVIKVNENGESSASFTGVARAALRPTSTARKAVVAAGRAARREARQAGTAAAQAAVSRAFGESEATPSIAHESDDFWATESAAEETGQTGAPDIGPPEAPVSAEVDGGQSLRERIAARLPHQQGPTPQPPQDTQLW